MGNRNRCDFTAEAQTSRFSIFHFLFSIFAFLSLGGCGAPGQPVYRTPPVPTAITDLQARQSGDSAQLTFSLPGKTVDKKRLAGMPSVEILRGSFKLDGSPDEKSFRIVYTIPDSLLKNYIVDGQVHFFDPIDPAEIKAHSGEIFAYRVRTRISRKKDSADSNTVSVAFFPVAEKITSLQATVTQDAIELAWPAPDKTSGGDPLPKIVEYRAYRGELDPASADLAARDLQAAKWKSPLVLVGSSPSNSHRDTTFTFDKTYLYLVRTVTETPARNPVESDNSNLIILTPHDTFPPATPQGVVGVVVVSSPSAAPEVDLSWSINSETDLAGYRVYRSEDQNTRGQLITPELLLSPSYRDISVELGHRYWYSIIAVDHAGNESAPSAPILIEVAQPFS